MKNYIHKIEYLAKTTSLCKYVILSMHYKKNKRNNNNNNKVTERKRGELINRLSMYLKTILDVDNFGLRKYSSFQNY